jgi:methyltransferase family protein
MSALAELRAFAGRIVRAPQRRACDRKLANALDRILTSPLEDLHSVSRMEDIIRSAGLVREYRNVCGANAYGADARYMNPVRRGLWQIPRQFAELLVFIGNAKIESVLEIGTFMGFTFAVLMTYLTRLNPSVSGKTLDVFRADYAKVSPGRFTAEYLISTTKDFAGKHFDLCFIDGDHSYAAVLSDYELVGRFARFSVFHDINDQLVEDFPANEGGVPRFWREVKTKTPAANIREFTYHSDGRRVMGIGVLIND